MDSEQSRQVLAWLDAGGLALIIAVILFGLRMYRTKDEIKTLEDIATHVMQVKEIAKMGVLAAQQLHESDQISEEDRFAHADKFISEVFPFMEANQRQTLIESAIVAIDAAQEIKSKTVL